MLKILPLLIKYGPAIWAFIKELIFKREDKRYFIRNKFQVFILLLLTFYSLFLYATYEGYVEHAKASKSKSVEIVRLKVLIKEKDKKIKECQASKIQIPPV